MSYLGMAESKSDKFDSEFLGAFWKSGTQKVPIQPLKSLAFSEFQNVSRTKSPHALTVNFRG
jgi:hypothetical protein